MRNTNMSLCNHTHMFPDVKTYNDYSDTARSRPL